MELPLTPLEFARRSRALYPQREAVVDGARRLTYEAFFQRCDRWASRLQQFGVRPGDRVAYIAPNISGLLEAFYAVPQIGAVLVPINYRLTAGDFEYIVNHSGARVVCAAAEHLAALDGIRASLPNVRQFVALDGAREGWLDYDDLVEQSTGQYERPEIAEGDLLTINYTSGTTARPKGVMMTHRNAYMNVLGTLAHVHMTAAERYLWTLPMFHCNGWTYTWGVTAVAGTHVCLRRVEPAPIFAAIAEHGVTHMCGAPIVLNMLVHAPEETRRSFDQTVEAATGGAAPPSAVIEAMERMGFRVTHLYGLTECYGPSTVCAWQQEWAGLPPGEKAAKMARQGVRYLTLDGQRVVDPKTMRDVPEDGVTIGELVLRSNTMMKGYLKNPPATEEAFAGGWFHTGDLAVLHPDGYAEIKDRSKDIIISGGENISSIEVEEALYRHPQIMEAAVVARPDDKWGETPCAFVTLKPDAGAVSAAEIIAWCRASLAHYKAPRSVVFGPLPKTSTGKVQKYALRERAKELT